MNIYELGSTVKIQVVFKDMEGILIDPTTVSGIVCGPDGFEYPVTPLTHPSTGTYEGFYLTSGEGEYQYKFTGWSPSVPFSDVQSGFFIILNYTSTELDYLIPTLRMYLGDITDPHRYTTDMLRQALVFSVRTLMRRWRSKYLVDVDGVVTRNPNYEFEFASPPVIQYYDEYPIILQAMIIIKSGSLQDASWQTASWRDDEISVSNIQGDRSRQEGIKRDIGMLEDYFKRRLYGSNRQSLPGFKYPFNYHEG